MAMESKDVDQELTRLVEKEYVRCLNSKNNVYSDHEFPLPELAKRARDAAIGLWAIKTNRDGIRKKIMDGFIQKSTSNCAESYRFVLKMNFPDFTSRLTLNKCRGTREILNLYFDEDAIWEHDDTCDLVFDVTPEIMDDYMKHVKDDITKVTKLELQNKLDQKKLSDTVRIDKIPERT